MVNLADVYPLSPMQRGMLFETLSWPNTGIYIEQIHCEFIGALNLPAFLRAWELVIARHAALRTAFVWEGVSKPVQAVRSSVRLPFLHEDWSSTEPDELQRRLASFLADDRTRGFDLRRAPLTRLALFRLTEERNQFVWSYHHTVLDGWSEALLLSEVMSLYASLARGGSASLPEVSPFRDYIGWLARREPGTAESSWKKALDGMPELQSTLVADQDSINGSAESEFESSLGTDSSAKITAFVRDHAITLNTLLLGTAALLLGRYRDLAELTIALVVSGRPAELPGSTEMVGLFVNTLPLRIQIPEQESAMAWLETLQRKHAELQKYQSSSLAEIQHSTGLAASTLVENLFVIENYPVDLSLLSGKGGLGIRNFKRETTRTKATLTLAIVPGSHITLKASCRPEKFPLQLAQRFPKDFERILANVIASPAQKLSEVRYAWEEEAQLLSSAGRDDVPESPCVHELIAKQSASSPHAVAVASTGVSLTYCELNRAADRLARQLRSLGAGSEKIVGLWLPRSAQMVVGILGVLKAAAAYLPLDVSLPAERLSFILSDAGVGIVVCDPQRNEPALPANILSVTLDADRENGDPAPGNAVASAKPEDLAYAIY